MVKVNTYPEMNAKIADLLKMGDNYTDLYAAQYIEELQTEVERLRDQLKASIELTKIREEQLGKIIHQPVVTLGNACPTCGGTDWLCVGCMDDDGDGTDDQPDGRPRPHAVEYREPEVICELPGGTLYDAGPDLVRFAPHSPAER
jgi:hypothetical protein